MAERPDNAPEATAEATSQDEGLPAGAPSHLREAARLYGVTAEDLEPLGAFESDVYAFERRGSPRVLKVISPTHRTAEAVQAEVDWLRGLVEAGVSVSEPVATEDGSYVATLPVTGHVVVAFERAPGELASASTWTDELVERWGRLLGQLQAHSRGYAPPGPRRHALSERSYVHRTGELAEEDPRYAAAAAEVAEASAPLLAPGGAGLEAGLVHADLHSGNFLAHEERLTAIDFDDCGYGSYAFDVAMPLYYSVRQLTRVHEGLSTAAAAERFLRPFLKGLTSVAPLPDGGGEAVQTALLLRQAELVAALNLKFLKQKDDPGLRALARDLRDRTVAGEPLVPLATLKAFFG